MKEILIMALPTIAVVLLKSKLSSSLDPIKRVEKTLFIINIFNIVMILFTPLFADLQVPALVFLCLFIGIQKEVFIEARDTFQEFMIENEGKFIFKPQKIEEETTGIITLADNDKFEVRAKYVGETKMKENTKYNVRVYLALNSSGKIDNVFCS